MKAVKFPKRQALRRGLLLTMFLFFPATLYYFSPVLILQGAAEGVLAGSALVFLAMLISSLFVGRAWCGWLCPAGGEQEACFAAQNKPVNLRLDWIKWVIWFPWMGAFGYLLVRAGGVRGVAPFYQLSQGLTFLEPYWFIIYYFVTGSILVLSLTLGRRAFCHTACWMAPFMIAGRTLRNAVGLPALQLKPTAGHCTACQQCTRSCPMSLPVTDMVQAGWMEHNECILCGSCVDVCRHDAIHYQFARPIAGNKQVVVNHRLEKSPAD